MKRGNLLKKILNSVKNFFAWLYGNWKAVLAVTASLFVLIYSFVSRNSKAIKTPLSVEDYNEINELHKKNNETDVNIENINSKIKEEDSKIKEADKEIKERKKEIDNMSINDKLKKFNDLGY